MANVPAKTRWNLRKEKFVEALLTGVSGAEAARRAGYSPSDARGRASALMKDPLVAQELEHRREKIREMTAYDVGRAMGELDAAMEFARETKNAGALAKTIELRTKLSGLMIERRDVRAMQQIKVEVVNFSELRPLEDVTAD